MADHGISLTFPAEAPAAGPVPVEVTMRADPRTYWDNDGIIDKALTVALVRRDRPGLRLLETIDPHAIMLPDQPLPGRPSDVQLDAECWTVSEAKRLDAAAPDPRLRGAADYFLVGAFSRWSAGPFALTLTDPQRRPAPAQPAPRAADGRPWPVRLLPADRLGSVRVERSGKGPVLVLPFDVSRPEASSPSDEAAEPTWLTVLGLHLNSKGGACGGLFALDVEPRSPRLCGEIALPLASLAPDPVAGRWRFQGFIGHHALPPAELTLSHDDLV